LSEDISFIVVVLSSIIPPQQMRESHERLEKSK